MFPEHGAIRIDELKSESPSILQDAAAVDPSNGDVDVLPLAHTQSAWSLVVTGRTAQAIAVELGMTWTKPARASLVPESVNCSIPKPSTVLPT
ncbi:MAG: hypothetical protein DYH08_13140 [Actinobacteria bacterium ATB1]|nr:hypothetical protein [Actinobacteria bacterium ATB1]